MVTHDRGLTTAVAIPSAVLPSVAGKQCNLIQICFSGGCVYGLRVPHAMEHAIKIITANTNGHTFWHGFHRLHWLTLRIVFCGKVRCNDRCCQLLRWFWALKAVKQLIDAVRYNDARAKMDIRPYNYNDQKWLAGINDRGRNPFGGVTQCGWQAM